MCWAILGPRARRNIVLQAVQSVRTRFRLDCGVFCALLHTARVWIKPISEVQTPPRLKGPTLTAGWRTVCRWDVLGVGLALPTARHCPAVSHRAFRLEKQFRLSEG